MISTSRLSKDYDIEHGLPVLTVVITCSPIAGPKSWNTEIACLLRQRRVTARLVSQ
jgi:hypothetical protein